MVVSMNEKNNISNKSGLTVLVVDEPIITDFLSKALLFSGHRPIIFSDAQIARDEFQKNPEEFDAVIVDSRIFFPELLGELLEHWQIPVLVWSQSASADDEKLKKDCVTILKKTIINHFSEILAWLNKIEPRTSTNTKEANQLIYILYTSKKADHFAVDDLIQVLNTSRIKNKRNGITGVLIYNKGYFLQILEGDMTVVNTLFYEHILKDKRHEKVAILSQGPIEQRDFTNWDMGFYGTSQNEDYDLLGNTNLSTHPAGAVIQKRLNEVRGIIDGFFEKESVDAVL
jgi:hypothetical protein